MRYATPADIPGIAGEDIEPGDVLGVRADGFLCVAEREIDNRLASGITIPHRRHAITHAKRQRVADILVRGIIHGFPQQAPKATTSDRLSFGYFRRTWWRKLRDSMRAW